MNRPVHQPCANGFTLVEMLVALALFGFLALATTLLAGNAARTFAFTQSALDRITRLERMRAVLAADLGQAAQRPTLTADGRRLGAFTLLPQGFVLVRRGVDGRMPPIEKVAWGFDGRRWLRQTFPALDGAAAGPATVLVDRVRAVRIRVAGPTGWTQDWRPRRPEDLPTALELMLVGDDGVPIVVRFLVGA
jgi:general secretion pathway protein J